MSDQKLVIVFALFPGVTQLDFTGPHLVFSRLPGATVVLASRAGGTVEADGIAFGGVTDNAIHDEAFLAELRRLAATARFVTSVCTGSLALGAAGLLRGKRAACHWLWRELLLPFGATPDPGRVVRDGNVITGGGVTAGIDFALSVAAELAGPETAQAIQLQIEYAPAPPFDAGCPETAPTAVLARVRERNEPLAARRREAVEAAAARLATV
jgi:cyclohexyl-isocyanide hydratase